MALSIELILRVIGLILIFLAAVGFPAESRYHLGWLGVFLIGLTFLV